jgi:arylformamidase
MTRVDHEADYNNRARVPEHAAIMAGWARDAAAYREAVGRRQETLRYGATDRQIIDVFLPDGASTERAVIFVHGGYWQSFDPSSFSHLARGLNAHGLAVAIPGYDLCPQVGIGDIVEEIRQACLRLADRGPLVVAGHSAGGHLAACMLATDWRTLGARADLVPAAYAISGLFDLPPLVTTSINQALRLTPAEAERLSPLTWAPPVGRTIDAVVGGDESAEYLRQSRELAERWGQAGVRTRYEAVPGANHFTVLAPLSDPDSAMTRRIAELALQES